MWPTNNTVCGVRYPVGERLVIDLGATAIEVKVNTTFLDFHAEFHSTLPPAEHALQLGRAEERQHAARYDLGQPLCEGKGLFVDRVT